MHRSLLISSLVLGSSCLAVAQEAVQSSSDIRFQECKADLLSADEDNDLLLRADEYLTFLNTFGPGDEQYDDLDDLPLSLLSTYVFSACFCTAFSNDPDCCVGPNAAVNMDEEESDLISMNLISFCRGVDKALGGSSPTPAPPAPSNSPTLFPTMGPNPTNSPTTSPTIADVPTFRPTFEGECCFDFQYGIINNEGFDANDILTMDGNSLLTGLLIATENVTVAVLDSIENGEQRLLNNDLSSTGDELMIMENRLVIPVDFLEDNSGQMNSLGTPLTRYRRLSQPQSSSSQQNYQRRRLAFFAAVEIPTIVDNAFCPSETPEVTRCAIVLTTTCVVLEEGDGEVENGNSCPESITNELLGGIEEKLLNGDFEQAIPPEDRLT